MSKGYRLVAEAPPEAGKVVAMVLFRDTIFVATEHRIYKMVNNQLEPVKFEVMEGGL